MSRDKGGTGENRGFWERSSSLMERSSASNPIELGNLLTAWTLGRNVNAEFNSLRGHFA
jgi:hypothetical protein